MPNWTAEQAKAIEERDANILVSAAAGSGKTAVLVERILQLILEDKTDITEMLIVTFTNAAAGEMRERILKALTSRLSDETLDTEHLRKQISILSRAHIKTLHAFCMDVIRQNFHQLDIDPAFRIGDISELTVLKQQVLDQLMEETYEKADPDFIGLVESYSGNRSDEGLQTMVMKLHNFLMSKPEPEVWLNEMTELYNLDINKLHKHIWIKTLLEDSKEALEAAKELIDQALKLCMLDEGPAEYSLALEADLGIVENLEEAMDKDIHSFIKATKNISYERLKAIPKKRREEVSETLMESVKTLRNHLKKDMIEPIKKTFAAFTPETLIEQAKEMKPLMYYLGQMAIDFNLLYSNAKRDKDMLDFNDLEHMAIKLFKNPDIANHYKNQFKYLFIDEYQDSNIVQETIINFIKRDNNLFMVGDVKQSIYKFRLADPSIFIGKYESYPKIKKDSSVCIDLNKNFRSRSEILHGINYLFENLMSKKFGEINYDQSAALYPGMDFEEHKTPSMALRIIDLDPPGIEIDEELVDMSTAESEARAIATEVKEILGTDTFDPREKKFRKIRYKDMVVLLRATRAWATIYQEVFAEEGIPLYAESNTGYFNAMEVQIILDFLRVIDNKQQDLPLISVLRSPIFGLKIEELVEIRIGNGKLSYFNAMENYIRNNTNDLAEKLSNILDLINDYSIKSQYYKLNEFIWQVIIETKYYHYVGALPGGDVRQANLKILVNHGDDFERTSLSGLFSFIRYLELITQSSGDMGEARTISENDDVLRLMSIHKSKGLEFPIVFVAGLGKQFNQQDLRSPIILHKDLGITARYVDAEKRVYNDSLAVAAAKRRIKLENLAEEMRILYVALTRAVDKLYLFGTIKNMDKQMDKWLRGKSIFFLKKSTNYLGWLMPILLVHRDFQELIKSYDKETNYFDPDEKSAWSVEVKHLKEVVEKAVIQELNDQEIKDYLQYSAKERAGGNIDLIERRFNWQYPYSKSENIRPKISVTDLNKLKNQSSLIELPELIEVPNFIKEEESLKGVDFGNITHAIMEHINLIPNINTNYIKSELDRLVLEKVITKEDANAVNSNKINKFYNSEIGKRMLNSIKIEREKPFVLSMDISEYVEGADENVIIQGIIDCYFEEEDGYVIVDFKTDSTKEQTSEEIGAKYKSQLELYAKALGQGTGKPVKEAVLYLFSSDETYRVL